MNESTKVLLNQIGMTMLASALSFLGAYFWFYRSNLAKKAELIELQHQKTIARIAELETQLALMNQAVIPISTAFQAILIKELTHYHTPEMDALMVKIGPPYDLTEEEAIRLAVLLEERTLDMGEQITESERDAAKILPPVMKRSRAEAMVLSSAEAMKIKLVTVAAVVGISGTSLNEK